MRIFAPNFRTLVPLLLVALSACSAEPNERVVQSLDEVPKHRAFFAEDPELLHQGFADGCSRPGDELTQVTAQITRCSIPPTPDIAAALLVRYDGALEAPKILIEKRTTKVASGYEVELTYFAEVPQKSGPPRRIYVASRRIQRQVERLLSAAGGTIIE